MVKKIIKILFITLGSLVALVMVLILVAGAGLLNGFLARTIGEQAGKKINGELNIGSIDGPLISHFTIRDISIIYKSDTLLFSNEIEIDYALKPLLGKEISLKLVRVHGVRLDLRQQADSSWNFMKLLKPGEEEADTSSDTSDWKISLGELLVNDFISDIATLDTASMIPSRIHAGLRLAASMSGDNLEAKVDSLKIITDDPGFTVVNLSAMFSKRGELLSWDDLILKLTGSRLESKGSYSLEESVIDAVLFFKPLDFSDLRRVIPELQLYGTPYIAINIDGTEMQYNLQADITEEDQRVEITATLSDYKNDPRYSARIEADRLNGSHWTGNKDLSSNISGIVNIDGNGFDIKSNLLRINAIFSNLQFGEYSASRLVLKGEKSGDRMSGLLESETFAGNFDMDFTVSDIFEIPAYEMLLRYRNVNADNFPGIDSLTTDIAGVLSLKGRGTDPDNIIADIILNSDSSKIMDQWLGDFTLRAEYDRGDYIFDLSDLGAPYLDFDATGNGNIDKMNDIRFALEPLDLTGLVNAFSLPPVTLSGRIEGTLSGTMDSLKTLINLTFSNIVYDTISVGQVNGTIAAGMFNEAVTGTLQLDIENVIAGTLGMQSADINAAYSDKLIEAELEVIVDDSLKTAFAGSVTGFENPVILISHFGIGYKKLEWSTAHDSASVILNKEDILVNNFSMGSGDQRIDIHGRFAFEGEEDLSVSISRLELETLPLGVVVPYEISGLVNAGLAITGTSGQPTIESTFNIDDLEVSGIQIDSVRSGISYANSMLRLKGDIASGLYESVNISAQIPLSIAFNDSISLLKDASGFNASISFDSLDLEKISVLFPVESTSIKGFADLNVEVGNTVGNPLISGTLELSNASVANNEYGADYDDIHLFASVDSSTVALDTLTLSTGKGNLSMNGYVSLARMDSLSLNDFSMALKASDFQAVESNSIELNFDSDLNISGTIGNPGFSGELDVNSSKINIDYFSTLFSRKTDDPNPPLLIEALHDTLEIGAATDTSGKAPAFSGTAFYRNLTGEITVDIPGNTWVTGKDMNFELTGSLRGVKKDENISLFGEMNVKRGYYKIYGRSFDFERGKITFTGSSQFNPDVDFEIVYSFRDIEKELRDLKLLITGKLMQPDLKFMLDDELLEEKDAISYIAFGKSVNQLGEGDREALDGQEVAFGAAVTQLSSALKGILQESAGVDVFEVTGGEDWKSGNVTIGKYITNNLFLSYDRSFDFDKQSKTADSEKIMLEYQILRNLIFKATNQEINSGFDFIWRKTWR